MGDEPRMKWRVTPEWLKFFSGLCLWFFLTFILIVAFYAAPIFFCHPESNNATKARIGQMILYQNSSTDLCTDFYNYACESHDRQSVDSTMLSATQHQIYSYIPKDISIDTDIPPNPVP